jgi:uncharacterized membrane protein YpjA
VKDAWSYFTGILMNRSFLWMMIVINGLGSIYGFYWYKEQLAETPEYLRIFVPDSPTASTFFTLVLITYLFRKSVPTLEAFAAVTSFKYGVWAVAVILVSFALGDQQYPEHYMLMISHGGMAIEALLYARFYSIQYRHILYVGAWTIGNDLLDYVLEIHPWVSNSLEVYHIQLGWATFGLSLLSLWLIYAFTHKENLVSIRP